MAGVEIRRRNARPDLRQLAHAGCRYANECGVNKDMNLVLLVGCARSGTSILGELIASHPAVKYIFEAHHIWELGGLGTNDSHRLTADHALPPIKKEVRDWFEAQSPGAATLVEKNPRNILRIPYVHEIFPEARIVHILRDGRDVACSMVPGCGRNEWSHLKPPGWRDFFASYAGAERCAAAWKQIMEIGLDDLRQVPHLQIRYEDLVSHPVPVMRQVLAYMGLDLHPQVVAFCSRVADETANSYHAGVQDRWYSNDHRRRVGRWRENLTLQEQAKIDTLLAPLLSQLGYVSD